MKLKNPVTAIWRSEASRGLKVIAYSLLLLFATSLPFIGYMMFGPEGGNPVALSWLFAGGAMLAHVGFFVGLLLLIVDHYLRR
ncbi:hypothetical protein [Marinimicrobium sp. ARAG 43.8]|uniref:hypothetical protein n=1 Tax=Marinimicrobium sp. ARAG 43.8 TaxID=3418719 RepID=UPI003CE9F101